MHATIDTVADTALARLSGRLTFAEISRFRTLVHDLEGSGCAQVVLDLEGVEYMDSAGMGMLLVARDRMAQRGAGVALRNGGGSVGRMLEIARFASLFAAEARNAQV